MQTLDNEEIPPPMPFNCRPFGSGLPMAARKIESHAPRSGKSFARNITARLVPPRMNTAGRASNGIVVLLNGWELVFGPSLLGAGTAASWIWMNVLLDVWPDV